MKKSSPLYTYYIEMKSLQTFVVRLYEGFLCRHYQMNESYTCRLLYGLKNGKIIIEDFTLQEKIAHIDQHLPTKRYSPGKHSTPE